MDDRAEKAMREALRAKAGEPDFQPLQLSPIRPRQWTRRLPAAAALVLVAAIAIPLLLNRLGAGAGMSAVPAQQTADSRETAASSGGLPAPRAGWRWESYRTLTYQVPIAWGYGYAPFTDWCVGRERRADLPQQPFVAVAPDRGAVRDILCPRNIKSNELRMFAAVRPSGPFDHGWDMPSRWSQVSAEIDGFVLAVVHPDAQAELARQIVATAQALPGEDANGCPAAVPQEGSTSGGQADAVVRASLCQYDLTGPPPLVGSQTLPTTQALGLLTSMRAAPFGTGPDDPSSCIPRQSEVVVVRFWDANGGVRNVFVRFSTCVGNGVFPDGEASRQLTEEVCQAVLTPPLVYTSGSGVVGALCMPRPTVRPTSQPSRATDDPTSTPDRTDEPTSAPTLTAQPTTAPGSTAPAGPGPTESGTPSPTR